MSNQTVLKVDVCRCNHCGSLLATVNDTGACPNGCPGNMKVLVQQEVDLAHALSPDLLALVKELLPEGVKKEIVFLLGRVEAGCYALRGCPHNEEEGGCGGEDVDCDRIKRIKSLLSAEEK